MSIDRYGPARDTKRIPGLCMSARCCGQAFFATLLAKKISFFDYADTLTYAYNGNGQQISVSGSGVIKTYAYTPAGMLASYTSGSDTQTNLYNGDGQRVQKKEESAVTNYFYQNGSVLYTTDSAGALKAFYLLNVSDAFATTIWNRKDRLDGLSFLLDRVDKQDFAGISKAEVSEIYLHVSQPTRKRLAFFC